MNRLEARYSQKLEIDKQTGLIQWWAFESVKFKLADKTYLTPDFIVMRNDGYLEAHEVKANRVTFWDDARVKVKVCAEKFPIKFVVVFPVKGSSDWSYEEI